MEFGIKSNNVTEIITPEENAKELPIILFWSIYFFIYNIKAPINVDIPAIKLTKKGKNI